MNAGFISEKEFREWQAAVARQYGIETPGSNSQAEDKAVLDRRDDKNRRAD